MGDASAEIRTYVEKEHFVEKTDEKSSLNVLHEGKLINEIM